MATHNTEEEEKGGGGVGRREGEGERTRRRRNQSIWSDKPRFSFFQPNASAKPMQDAQIGYSMQFSPIKYVSMLKTKKIRPAIENTMIMVYNCVTVAEK